MQLLFSSCETEEECRNVVAECLGHLALLYPSKTLPLLQQQSQVRGQDSSSDTNPPAKRRRMVWSCHTLRSPSCACVAPYTMQLTTCSSAQSLPCLPSEPASCLSAILTVIGLPNRAILQNKAHHSRPLPVTDMSLYSLSASSMQWSLLQCLCQEGTGPSSPQAWRGKLGVMPFSCPACCTTISIVSTYKFFTSWALFLCAITLADCLVSHKTNGYAVLVMGSAGFQWSYAHGISHGHEVHPCRWPSPCRRTSASAHACHAEPYPRSGPVRPLTPCAC